MISQLPIISTLGGHSALEICFGAKRQGLKTLVITQKGRDKTYRHYYNNLVDEIINVDSFTDLTNAKIINQLKQRDCLFIPHRYIQVYCDLDAFENNFTIPVFGNKYLLKYEEREGKYSQYQLLKEAKVDYPLQFRKPKDIDRLVLVKVKESIRGYERAFFFAKNFAEFKLKSQKLIDMGKIKKSDLETAVIEEYLIGAQVNFNFFYSPLTNKLELLGTDVRRQTNVDGLIRLPAQVQEEIIDDIIPSYIETGHIAVTVKESLLEKAFELAERLLSAARKIVSPGIIGPFALQTAIIPGPPIERIVVYDISLRMPGSPGSIFTPYSQYHFGKSVSFGEKIALEIKEAIKLNKISRITT